MRSRCLVCNAPIERKQGSTRRPRRDKLCCSATCRKRMSRRRAAGSVTAIDLPGQQMLPLTCDSHRSPAASPKRQPQDRSGSTIDVARDL
jgi:hypothetical protein